MLSAVRAEILAVPVDPRDAGRHAIVHHADGLLVMENGLIVARGNYADLAPRFAQVPIADHRGILLVPGFVDAHVHYPQTDSIAAHGLQLLDWLDEHIYPAERAFADPVHANEVASFFLDELLRNGTTTALVFATVHTASVDALFEQALARGMRLISGKVLMDLGPPGLADCPQSARADSEALIARWRGRGRLGYAVTPRFTLSCSDEQLHVAGELVATHPDVLMHTHLSESLREVAAVDQRFAARDYVSAYAGFGLVGARSVFAHGIHLNDNECAALAQAGAALALCPTSNLFLGSGLFDLARLDAHGVHLGLGTDVGAGTSFSMLATMSEAYKVCQLRGQSLDPFRALYLATSAGARALGLADRIGGLGIGQEADFVLLNPAATPLTARRCAGASLAERLFALQVLGDDRHIHSTWLMGKRALT